jgi:hypothetical protein
MKQFRTIINPEPSPNKIGYQTPVLFMGSCFTENIGNIMADLKFPVIVNPFGVMYNPISVQKGLEILIDQVEFKESDLGFFNEQWFSFYHDTVFSDIDQKKCLDKINDSVKSASRLLRNAKYLVITFGTSWVYRYLKSGNIVSNCHKIPAKEFERLKIGTENIFVEWANLINRLNELNKNLKIIFTVSPVRHWKDGAIENQLSKATLILAIHQLKERYKNVEYFPAYEIMMDDLRDYRFYADDMLHPSKVAINYIWDQFSQTYIEKDTNEIIKEIEKIILAKNHRPLNPNTPSHKKFIESQIESIEVLEKKYPFLDFSKDKSFFKSKI